MTFIIYTEVNKTVDQAYRKAIKELNQFFTINWKKDLPNLFLLPDRKTIDLLCQRKTEDWLVGWSRNRSIYLLAPQNYDKESRHLYSREAYFRLIKHELVHAFVGRITAAGKCPVWLNEGLALFLAGQNEQNPRPRRFAGFLKYYRSIDKQVYKQSGHAVELLIKRYGKTKLISFLKALRYTKNKNEVDSAFKKVYGRSLSYALFNELL